MTAVAFKLAATWAVGLWDALRDFCYPGMCAACSQPSSGPAPLCGLCLANLSELEEAGACQRCARPLAMELAPCPFCHGKGLYPLKSILRLGVYDQPLRACILAMKYRRRWPLGEYLAARLRDRPAVARLLEQADCIVPVPLHWRRQLARGYNQSHVIAACLATRQRPVVRAIMRRRDTEAQARLRSRDARQENMRDAFRLVRPKAVAGRRVLLVDDVTTTGATLQWAARALLEAKPAAVSGLVLAVADPAGRDFTSV